jgi:hypothetical protein
MVFEYLLNSFHPKDLANGFFELFKGYINSNRYFYSINCIKKFMVLNKVHVNNIINDYML